MVYCTAYFCMILTRYNFRPWENFKSEENEIGKSVQGWCRPLLVDIKDAHIMII